MCCCISHFIASKSCISGDVHVRLRHRIRHYAGPMVQTGCRSINQALYKSCESVFKSAVPAACNELHKELKMKEKITFGEFKETVASRAREPISF